MKKRLLWLLLPLGTLALVIVYLPTIVASDFVRDWVTNDLLAPEGVDVEIERISLGWFSPTEVTGISLGPQERPRLVHVDQVWSDRSFWNGLWEGVDVGALLVDRPKIHLWFERGQSNLDFNLKDDQDEPTPIPQSANETTTLSLGVNQAELWIKTDTMPEELLVFKDVDIEGTLRKGPDGRFFQLTPGRIFDHAKISPELCVGGLKYIVPVLSEATWAKGEFSMELAACDIDLDDPGNSNISGKLYIHGIEAGINNELLAAASKRVAARLGRGDLDTIHLAADSVIDFQVRDGMVTHEGVEFGLPRVDPDLVVRTSGTVTFDEQLDLNISVPIPLHLIADGPLAQAITDKSLILHAGGSLKKPEISVNDEDFLGDLISNIGTTLLDQEKPIQGMLEGIRASILGRDRQEESEETGAKEQDVQDLGTPILDRIRERRKNQDGPLKRLFDRGDGE